MADAFLAQDKLVIFSSLASLVCLLVLFDMSDQLSKALMTAFSQSGVPKEFEDWCVEKKLLTCMGIALLAVDEKYVANKIVQACKAKVSNVSDSCIEVSICKAWWFCREALEHPQVDSDRKD